MGNCGQASTKITVSEQAIVLPKYSSETDFIFNSFDKKYNFLKDVSLFDFLLSLQNLQFTKSPDSSYNNFYSKDEKENIFRSFIDTMTVETFLDKTVGNHPRHYNKDAENCQIFEEYFKQLIEYMIKGQTDYYKKNRMSDKYNKDFKKYMLIIIGLLYCSSKDMEKINVLFSCIADQEGVIEDTPDLNLFVYMMIFTASFANFSSVYKLNQDYDQKLPTIKTEERAKWDDYFGLYQVEKVFQLFKTKLFEQNQAISYNQFYAINKFG